MAEKRYYYKKDGKAAYNLKEPLSNILDDTTGYEEIDAEEWAQLTYVAPVEPVEPTAEEIAAKERAQEIAQLKAYLSQTDYVIIKIAEEPENADALRTEYADVIAQRKQARARINELEGE